MKTEQATTPQKGTLSYVKKVKHIFLTFLQEFCSKQHPGAGMFYNPDDLEASNILILDSYAHDLEQMVGRKPVIVFKRGPLFVSQGFLGEDLLRRETRLLPKDQVGGRSIRHDLDYRTFMFTGTADWQCFSRQGLESEEIATVVAMLHQAHKQVLMQKGLHSIKSIQIGEEMMVEGDVETEMVLVPVSITFELQAHYEYWEDAPVFDHANILGDTKESPGDLLLNTDP